MKKKLLIIGGIVITTAIVVFGFIYPPPDGFLGASRNETTIAHLQTKYDQSPEIKGKYQLENGALVREAKSDPKDRIEVVIGNKTDPKSFGAETTFEPTMEI